MRASLLILILLGAQAMAELPPSAYEAMQAKAPEHVKIEVARVEVEPGETPVQQSVRVMALVNDVMRSASGLKRNDVITIVYSVTEHPKGWAGPGAVPILTEKHQSVAYLERNEKGDYIPAAGRMSFSEF